MVQGMNARDVILRIIKTIEEKKDWLSEIDGAIGDGDHGVNMAKGFGMVKSGIDSVPNDFSKLLNFVGITLVTNIGGAMGPIYGTFFMRMGKAVEGKSVLEKEDILRMLSESLEGVKKRGGAEVGDKTLVDTLDAAKKSYERAINEDRDLREAIDEMIEGAKKGMESTKDFVAKKGRSSRLGERSKGTIDAGAASCYLILKSIGESLKEYI
jgi:dihydroxyacetone kinase-like protein